MTTTSDQEYDYSPPLEPITKYTNISIEDGSTVRLSQGDQIWNLTISRCVGKGGFGAVYRCVDSDRNEYALKKIPSKIGKRSSLFI